MPLFGRRPLPIGLQTQGNETLERASGVREGQRGAGAFASHRNNSSETLATLVNPATTEPGTGELEADENPVLSSTHSNGSFETITEKLLGVPASLYTNTRILPVASGFMKNGVLVFPLDTSLQIHRFCKQHLSDSGTVSGLVDTMRNQGLGLPVLQTHLPLLGGVFKKSAPFMIIYRFLPPKEGFYNQATPPSLNNVYTEKYEFAKVYYKQLNNQIMGYVLQFTPTPNSNETFEVVMLNNTVKACTDVVVKNSKLRVLGTTSSSSMFGSSFLQVLAVDDTVSILNDYYVPKVETREGKKRFVIETGCPLLNDYHQNPLRDFFNGPVRGGRQPFRVLGHCDDTSDTSMAKREAQLGNIVLNKVLKHGEISVLEAPDPRQSAWRETLQEALARHQESAIWPVKVGYSDTIHSVCENENTLILACLMLVLRDQEKRKVQGARRPLTVAPAEAAPRREIDMSSFVRGLPDYM